MRRVDLNLLYVLRELLKEPNTTKVAEKLNLTQSAVSASLSRLRWAFQDDLFVRSGRAMAPTKRAEDLLNPVEDIIQRVECLVEEVHFDPENLQRNFTLSTTDFLLQRVAGPIIGKIHSAAPNTRIIFTPLSADTRDRVRSGHLDLMIAPILGDNGNIDQVNTQPLYTDHLVAAAWSGSERYGDTISEKELLDATHLTFNPGMIAGWKSSTQSFIETKQLQLKTIAEFANFNAILYSLRGSDLITIMPKKLVDVVGKDAEVRAIELPYDMPEFDVALMWNRSFENDPEHIWLREMVESSIQEL